MIDQDNPDLINRQRVEYLTPLCPTGWELHRGQGGAIAYFGPDQLCLAAVNITWEGRRTRRISILRHGSWPSAEDIASALDLFDAQTQTFIATPLRIGHDYSLRLDCDLDVSVLGRLISIPVATGTHRAPGSWTRRGEGSEEEP